MLDTDPYADAYYTSPKYTGRIYAQDTITETQWLKNILDTAKEPWKIVIGHHPAYCTNPEPGETETFKRIMVPIFAHYHVQAYICGHDHIMQYHLPAGSHTGYIISGGGAKPEKNALREPYTLFSKNTAAFTRVSISGNKLSFSFIDSTGAEVYHNEINRD